MYVSMYVWVCVCVCDGVNNHEGRVKVLHNALHLLLPIWHLLSPSHSHCLSCAAAINVESVAFALRRWLWQRGFSLDSATSSFFWLSLAICNCVYCAANVSTVPRRTVWIMHFSNTWKNFPNFSFLANCCCCCSALTVTATVSTLAVVDVVG